ncbi:hypothetical protein GCM10011380_13170 [Sphingomonas metalli]|uniref:Uncharacterized protein n=1 Tax=Sphingomonas metalli TaxID=1779358 RepID=A0A916SZF5_9SPHN|nr:hypothetical protein [Sphingomonas metalli]GGB24961.1 hypothetical protein GCM10011380_13170 [Sphingomonas metalli]
MISQAGSIVAVIVRKYERSIRFRLRIMRLNVMSFAFSAVITLTTATAALNGLQLSQPSANHSASRTHGVPPTPPPPPEIYDPQSGPFIVRMTPDGEIDEQSRGVAENAVRQWTDLNLQRFIICYRSASQGRDYSGGIRSLESVARELKAHGAIEVVMPDGGPCSDDVPRPTSWNADHVVILGVVHL